MRLRIAAVGRMKAGPERELVARYTKRLSRAGPALGLEFAGVAEIAESRAPDPAERKRDEAERLLALLPADGLLLALDERGKTPGSAEFAERLARMRDAGARDLTLVVGGPDGLSPDLVARASGAIAFGRLTLPHQIVRILLAEQLYRAVTILSGHPYHRE